MAVNHWLYISVILSATFIYCWVCGWACGCWLMFSANVRGRTIKFLTPKLVGPTTNRVGFGIKAIVKCFRNLSPIKIRRKKQWEKNRKEEKKLRWIWLSSLPKTRKHKFQNVIAWRRVMLLSFASRWYNRNAPSNQFRSALFYAPYRFRYAFYH